jgi:hypothetical protein
MGLRYARLEKKLGEVDRARAIYMHLSQYTDPQEDVVGLWKVRLVEILTKIFQEWEEFELQFGNEDTYTEMMRVRRTVMTKFVVAPPTLAAIQDSIEMEKQKAQ